MTSKSKNHYLQRSNTLTTQIKYNKNAPLQKYQIKDQKKRESFSKNMTPITIINTKSEKTLNSNQLIINNKENIIDNNRSSTRKNSLTTIKERNKNIKVYCRFRPLNEMEISLLKNNIGWIIPEYDKIENKKNIIRIQNKNPELINTIDNRPSFSFDKIFSENSSQKEIYENIGKEIVKDVMDGYNGTIFAYGQSGSGKTYTMYGDIYDNEIKGVIPRIIEEIFNYVELSDENISFQFKLSVVQIYKEIIFDLLTGEKNLIIKESPTKGIFIDNLSEVYLSSIDDFLYYSDIAESNRKKGETKLNRNSSRSHSIMILEVSQKFKRENIIKKGILNLVDLAGSEKVSKTNAIGETLEEAKKINLSLSALGNVIHSLTSNSDYIPYRNSKLTRILKESLGGNYKTSLIVTCSPHSYNLDESISSLQFAQRVKNIKNKVKINIKYSYEELQQIVYQLKKKLEIANQKILKLKKGENFIEDYDNNYLDNDDECYNCNVLKEEKNNLESKIEELNNIIKEKNEEIEKINNKNNNSFSSDNFEDKSSKIKNLYENIKNILNDIQNENQKFNNDNINNNLIIQNDNFNQLISNYINNSNKKEFFDEINKMLLNNLKSSNNEKYNSIYNEYVKNLNDIYLKIESNKNIPLEELLNLFSINYFYEYLHYYFSYQLLNKSYEKIKNDNETINNINSQLTEIIGNLLSSNYEMANNNQINENAINLIKTINEPNLTSSINLSNTIDNNNINIHHTKMSVTFGNDISQKFIKVVSKKNLNLGKNKKLNTIFTLNNANNNLFNSVLCFNNNSEKIIDSNDKINDDNFDKYKSINLFKSIPNEDIHTFENKKIVDETKENQSLIKMIEQVFVSNIKKNEDLLLEIENIKKDFDKVINYNNNYFSNLILDKNKEFNNNINKENKNEKNNLKIQNLKKTNKKYSEECNIENENDLDKTPKNEITLKYDNVIKDKETEFKDKEGNKILKIKRIDKYNNHINNDENNKNNNLTRNKISNNNNINEKKMKNSFSNLLFESSNIEFQKKKINNRIIPLIENKEDENHLQKSIEKFLETGTASRRFDGIKVNVNNGIVNYEYASGLSANQKIINTPLQNQKIKELLGDDDEVTY